EAGLLRPLLVALRDVDAVRAVLVDDGDLEVLWLLAELRPGVLSDEVHRHQAELAAARLHPEHVFQIAVLEHGRGDACGDPHELLQLLDARGISAATTSTHARLSGFLGMASPFSAPAIM